MLVASLGPGVATAADGAAPATLKLDRRILAPAPDYAMPRRGGTVSPAHIAADGWQHCALSFDDGPNEVTPRILAILAREGVIATFFPIAATAARHPEAIRTAVAAGHEIGNHSLGHGNLTRRGPAAQRADLAEANRILTNLGARPVLFRPPYAAYDGRLIESARSVGLETVLWSLDVRDWEVRDAGMLAARVNAGAGPALVVLLHATYEWTERALPQIIAALRGHGCRFVTLSQWLAFMHGGAPAAAATMVAAATPSPTPAPSRILLPTAEPPPPARRPTIADAPMSPPDRPVAVAAATPRPLAPAPEWRVVPASVPPPDDPDARPVQPAPEWRVVPASVPPPDDPDARPATPVPAMAAAAVVEPIPPPTRPAAKTARPAVAPSAARPAPALTLRAASVATTRDNRTVLRIEGDNVFLQLGPNADLDAIATQLKEALGRPRR
ncbi:MAG: polysaccharide deacetylase family protein [Proteobacteria bacterium]|nr:polysaccharide deacetylase family protein [Pseudomonadota bacterium]